MGKYKQDVIIIGSGIGGLSAGAYLAQKGYKVKIFERLAHPGGYVNSFKRGEYYFEGSTHILYDFFERDFNYNNLANLGITDVKTTYLEHVFEAILFNGDKIDKRYLINSGESNSLDSFQNYFPDELTNIKDIYDKSYKITRNLYRLLKLEANNTMPHLVDLISAICLLAKEKSITSKLGYLFYPAMRDNINRTFADILAKIENKELKFVISLISAMCLLLPAEKASAIVGGPLIYQFFMKKPVWVCGGLQTLIDALIKKITGNGGEMYFRSNVDEIIIERNTAVGVRLADGEEHYAKFVISNADAYTTSNSLLKSQHIKQIETHEYISSKSIFQVYLGLPFDIREYGFKSPTTMFSNSVDMMSVFNDDCGDDKFYIITNYSMLEEGSSTKGKSSIAIATYDSYQKWADMDNKVYYSKKKEFQDKVVNKIALLTGIPLDKRELIFSATPRTMKHYSGNAYGGMVGSDHIVEQFGFNRPGSRLKLKNLHLVGHDAQTGGGINCVLNSGLVVGNRIIRNF